MNKVSDYISVGNYIPKELCESFIEEGNTKEWEKHTWYDYEQDHFSSKSTKELDILFCTEKQLKEVSPYLKKALEDYQTKYSVEGENTNTSWISRCSSIRFNKYPVGTMMRMHYDHIHSLFEGENKGIPILSIVGQLNENYEGAEFYCRGKEITLKTGDILLFPSNFMYPHEVKETKKGVRYSFSSWAF